MDLTRTVTYRGFELNSIYHDEATRDLQGCEITACSMGSIIGVGYDEKRAMDEGRDAGDVYLDQRLISLSGVIYGRTRAEAFDLHRQFTNVMTPSDAYEANPSRRGYLPFYFASPSDERWGPNHPQAGQRIWPGGVIPQMLQVRPLATPSAQFAADRSGGRDDEGLAIPWTAQLAAKDPRITTVEVTRTSMRAALSDSGTVRNRGNRPAVVEVYLTIPPRVNGTAEGLVYLKINECMSITFHLPYKEKAHTLRYSSDQKTLAYGPAGGGLGLRMDLLQFRGNTTHTHLPVGEHGWQWSHQNNKNLQVESYFEFRDTWV